jgi:hypothetical protein
MSVIITSKSLLPVRRDKQIAWFNSVTGGGGFSGNGSGCSRSSGRFGYNHRYLQEQEKHECG